MSRIKELIMDRENQVIELIHKMEAYDDPEIVDAWETLSLPSDADDFDILFDVVTDEERFEYVITQGTEFLTTLEENKR